MSEQLHLLFSLHSITHAISWQPLNAATWVQSQVTSCGTYGGWSVTAVGFLGAFPMPLLSPPNVPFSSIITQGCYNGSLKGPSTKGLSLTYPTLNTTQLSIQVPVFWLLMTHSEAFKYIIKHIHNCAYTDMWVLLHNALPAGNEHFVNGVQWEAVTEPPDITGSQSVHQRI
jgi:hypothetical protein